MSDAVTNVEIEDVLSSIRRLVAQGDTPREAVFSHKNSKPAEQPSKFVLTPALRVAQDVDAVSVESDADVTPAAAPLVLTIADMMQEPLLHDGMSELERASLEATIAELEAAVMSQAEEWEPDGTGTVLTSGFADAFAAMQADDEDDEVSASEPVVTLHPQRAETAFRRVPVDAPVIDAQTDHGDALPARAAHGTPIPDNLDETLAAYSADGAKLEHAEMRALVAEVVRQELQGDLGERITRNIRKLVRAEVNRAMSVNLND